MTINNHRKIAIDKAMKAKKETCWRKKSHGLQDKDASPLTLIASFDAYESQWQMVGLIGHH